MEKCVFMRTCTYVWTRPESVFKYLPSFKVVKSLWTVPLIRGKITPPPIFCWTRCLFFLLSSHSPACWWAPWAHRHKKGMKSCTLLPLLQTFRVRQALWCFTDRRLFLGGTKAAASLPRPHGLEEFMQAKLNGRKSMDWCLSVFFSDVCLATAWGNVHTESTGSLFHVSSHVPPGGYCTAAFVLYVHASVQQCVSCRPLFKRCITLTSFHFRWNETQCAKAISHVPHCSLRKNDSARPSNLQFPVPTFC